ncbi:Peptidase S74 domain-containing protein [Entamoeba marina]
MQPNDVDYVQENGILLVSSDNIPRTKKMRKKNWKCIYPNCNEPVKTRFNCYAHVWDTHLRQEYTQNSDEFPATPFKKTVDKTKMKPLCEAYMIQLVEKDIYEQKMNCSIPFPFDFIDSTTKSHQILQCGELQLPNNQNVEQLLIQTDSNQATSNDDNSYKLNLNQQLIPFDNMVNDNIVLNDNNVQIEIGNNNDTRYSPENQTDFIRIYHITNGLRRLHVYGEIFAENGFFVRSDERFKTNIKELGSVLNNITSLVGKKYRYVTDSQMKYGFIAQEVCSIFPNLVHSDNGVLCIDILGIIPLIVEALKEIQDQTRKEIEELSEMVENALKAITELTEINSSDELNIIRPEAIYKEPLLKRVINMFTLITICIGCIVPKFYFIFTTTSLISLVLWMVLAFRYKDIKLLLCHKYHLRIEKIHFIMWYTIAVLCLISVSMTVVMGALGLRASFIYILFSIVSSIALYFLYQKTSLRFRTVSIILLLYYIFALVFVILTCVIQPFYVRSINGITTPFNVNAKLNEPIETLTFSDVPWNCFQPTVSAVGLPTGLIIDVDDGLVIYGAINTDIETVDVHFKVVCSGAIVISYGKATFKTCQEKTEQKECLENGCGWTLDEIPHCIFCEEFSKGNITSLNGCIN